MSQQIGDTMLPGQIQYLFVQFTLFRKFRAGLAGRNQLCKLLFQAVFPA
jgi:hypothetical protein